MVTFLFSVHTITEAKQQAGQNQGGGSSRSFDLARHGVAPPLCAILYNLMEQQQIIHWSIAWNWTTVPCSDLYVTCKEAELKQMAGLSRCEFELLSLIHI